MSTTSTRRLAAACAILGLGAAGTTTAALAHGTESHTDGPAPMTHSDAPRKAPAKMALVALAVTPDPMKGHNLVLRTRAFRFAPERASTAHRAGEGHAHLYVDGVKRTRLYGPAYYLGDLTPGRHVVRVTLNANDHRDFWRGGKPLAREVVVEVPQPAPAPAMG